jgi:ribonuclease HI
MEKLIIACDGGCRGNQEANNVGGYGIIIQYMGKKAEFIGGETNTTNNKMELMACIVALEKAIDIKNTPIEIVSDSAYIINAFNQKWIEKWKRNGWRNSKKEPVANRELWERVLKLIQDKDVTFTKVKGHADNELNQRADELANIAMDEIIKKGLTKLN